MITIDGGTGVILHNGIEIASDKMHDQWVIESDASTDGYTSDIPNNWTRSSISGAGAYLTGMSHSSGTFTFPSTGIYLIGINGTGNSDGGGFNYVRISITVTVNDSSYLEVAGAYQGLESNNHHWAAATQHIFDVTDTSTHKVKFQIQGSNTRPMCYGDTNANRTVALFTRLGDT